MPGLACVHSGCLINRRPRLRVLTADCQGFAARDLRLHALLLEGDGSDGTRPLLKVCDYDYSHSERDAFGTTVYLAPEVLQGCNKHDAEVLLPLVSSLSIRLCRGC